MLRKIQYILYFYMCVLHIRYCTVSCVCVHVPYCTVLQYVCVYMYVHYCTILCVYYTYVTVLFYVCVYMYLNVLFYSMCVCTCTYITLLLYVCTTHTVRGYKFNAGAKSPNCDTQKLSLIGHRSLPTLPCAYTVLLFQFICH